MNNEPLPVADYDGDLDLAIRDVLECHSVPGAAVALIAPGGAPFASGYGVRALSDPSPVTVRTAFNVASVSKSLCATAAAVLVDRGVMSWDDPIRRWLPEFKTRDPQDAERMTLRDLSGNRSGLPRNGLFEFGTELAIDAEEVVRRLRFAIRVAPAGSRFTYSNIAHTAVALAIERATDVDYATFLERHVFEPLGMDDASTGRPAARHAVRQAGWHCALDGQTLEIPQVFTDVHRGSAGACLSARDACRWLAFNLGDGGTLLSSACLQELFSPQIDIPPKDLAIWIGPPDADQAAYGLGWGLARQNGSVILRHSGSDFGVNAHVAACRERGVAVAAWMGKDCKASQEISYRVMDRLMGWPPRAWDLIIADRRLPDTNAGFRHSPIRPGNATPARPLNAYVGRYHDDRDGLVTVTEHAGQLRLAFADAPVFDGELAALGGDRFLAVPDYPGLVSDAVGGRFEVNVHFDGNRAASLEMHGIARFRRYQ